MGNAALLGVYLHTSRHWQLLKSLFRLGRQISFSHHNNLSLCPSAHYVSDCRQVMVYGSPHSHHNSRTRNWAATRKNGIAVYRHKWLFCKTGTGQKCPSSSCCHPLKIYSCSPYTKTQTTSEIHKPALPLKSAFGIAFLQVAEYLPLFYLITFAFWHKSFPNMLYFDSS